MSHTFIAMWDCNGLEYIDDVTADEQRVMWEKLQGKSSPVQDMLLLTHSILDSGHRPILNATMKFICFLLMTE